MKQKLVQILDDIFKPLGFKRKGNYWRLLGTELEKIIYLQKSSFSRLYYINYGFNIVNLDFDAVMMHVHLRLGSINEEENKRICDLLDFESNIEAEARKEGLVEVIKYIVEPQLSNINTEEDILNKIKADPSMQITLPLRVKEYLGV